MFRIRRNWNAPALVSAALACICLTGTTLAEFEVDVVATRAEVQAFLQKTNGSPSAKLVYVNRRILSDNELHYIDFTEEAETSVIHKISAAPSDVQLPVLSSDGNWVVYATGTSPEAGGNDGGNESVYICKLDEAATPVLVANTAHEPRFMWQMKNATTLTVIYPTTSVNEQWTVAGQTMQVDIDVASGTPQVGTPSVLYDVPFTGGASWDGDYLCGGGTHAAMRNIVEPGAETQVVSQPHFAQACNASISSSRTAANGAMMYLVFSGSHASINNGKYSKDWQVIVIGSGDGDVLTGYWYPTGSEYLEDVDSAFSGNETYPTTAMGFKWHHNEWSNHPYFAVATLNVERSWDLTGNADWANTKYQERIYLLGLRDSTYLEVIRPSYIRNDGNVSRGVYWPFLWVQVPDGFQEDEGWLSAPKETTVLADVAYAANNGIVLTKRTIVASSAIAEVSLYRANGTLVERVTPTLATRKVALNSLAQPVAGMYVIRILTTNNACATLRFAAVR